MNEFIPPVLLSQLTPDQKLRILSMDYIYTNPNIPPLLWVTEAEHMYQFLKNGVVRDPMIKKEAVHVFHPKFVE